MHDLGVPPIFLFQDERPRLLAVREEARQALARWAECAPTAATEAADLVPIPRRSPIPEESLLTAGLWSDSHQIRDYVYAQPHRDAPVFRKAPALWARKDADGLVSLEGLDARPHGLFLGPLAVHYHQFLRRGFLSNVNYELVRALLAASERKGTLARIAIDEWRVRHRDEHEEIEEKEYWYGPKAPLSEEGLDDPRFTGQTVHGDSEGGQSFFHPYGALRVRVTNEDESIKTLEIEEWITRGHPVPGRVLAWYLHARRDVRMHTFVHCDGAVKIYDRDAYPDQELAFDRLGKAPEYPKVFRIDGKLPTAEWCALTIQWFQGNSLAGEYLGGLLHSDPQLDR